MICRLFLLGVLLFLSHQGATAEEHARNVNPDADWLVTEHPADRADEGEGWAEVKADPQSEFGSNAHSGFQHRVQWIWAAQEGNLAQVLLDTADLLGDGEPEFLVRKSSGRNGFSDLFVKKRDLQTPVCVLHSVQEPIRAHYVFQPVDSLPPRVLIAHRNGVSVMNGRTCEVVGREAFPGWVSGVGIGDVNGNGIPDVAFSVNGDLYVAPWNRMGDASVRRGFGGDRIVVGSLGRAGGDDIGVASSLVRVLRGDTLETITEIPVDQPEYVEFADVTGDGVGNIVVRSSSESLIKVYDLDDPNPRFAEPVSWTVLTVTRDVTGNGIQEIVSQDYSGPVRVIDGDGVLLHSIDFSPDVTGLQVADVDGSGELDMVWSAWGRLYRADVASESIVWSSEPLVGPYSVAALDRGRTLLSAASPGLNSWLPDEAVLKIVDRNGDIAGAIPTVDSIDVRISAMATHALEHSAGTKVCLTGRHRSDFLLKCIDRESGETLWRRTSNQSMAHFLQLDDVDGNGELDLLLIGVDGIVYLYDAESGFLKWQSENLNGFDLVDRGFKNIAVVDGAIWLIIGDRFSVLYELDAVTGDTRSEVEYSSLKHISLGGGRIFGFREGEGVGVVDLSTRQLEELIHPMDGDKVTMLTASPDGKVVLVATGVRRPGLNVSLISTNDDFPPLNLGEMSVWDAFFTDSNDLVITSGYGAIRLHLDDVIALFGDRFEG